MKYTYKKLRRPYILLLIASLIIPSVFYAPPAADIASAASFVKPDSSYLSLTVGDTATLKLSGVFSGITWSSSDKNIVSVTSSGKITARKKGTSNVIATYNGIEYDWIITVKNSLLSAIKTGDTQELSKTDTAVVKKIYAVIATTITSGMTNYEKVKAIHDYIVLNCAYDIRAFKNSSSILDSSYHAVGCLLYKTAVCQGYAESFQLFMTALGIPNELLTGTASQDGTSVAHAWNSVKLGKKWYHVDTTWDDPAPDTSGYLRYDYFLRNDDFFLQDHSWKQNDFSASTSTAYLMKPYTGLIVTNTAQAEKSFLTQQKQGITYYTFVYKTGTKINFDFLFRYAKKNGYQYFSPVERGEYMVYVVFF